MLKKSEHKFLITIVVIIAAYWVYAYFAGPSPISTVITTSLALISAVTFWLQLKRTEKLNEANFIMTLNHQFIFNKDMADVENALDVYYTKYDKLRDRRYVKLSDDWFNEDEGTDQRLVNYLVYLEGLYAIIQRDVVHLDLIDDLFAYRFFVAVNNPDVQEKELLPNSEYYPGCFRLSEYWTEQWRKKKRSIPLGEFTLCERPIPPKEDPRLWHVEDLSAKYPDFPF